ncbi:MAG: hypothetical protein K9J32_00755 [Synechococcus lacustris]|jgi:hypothetical protein|uniref:Uncharacterized protein n=1 Tax=Synechococcus lacustris str. Tous TaxID=1910958 RepID=A0A2P7EH01_9SYNE|nr:hypothetical protein [Synechococcus lacustris]HBU26191.1 hypothetical protein [Synechococcales bacterium UBA8138]MCF8134008.1 hypothetical protein [Synechococcus lacustris]MCP9794170.1 hypothetical protein [Synechococcus lacustris L1F-Slac]OON12503.1 MAG: hypothetical protein BTM30_04460 [Synechococcus lacustris str. Tous]PSI02491.1 hypothetical protein C7K08_02300 [Synechococcus lacustris str. Tous]
MSQSPTSNPLLNLGLQAAQRLVQEALAKFQGAPVDSNDLVTVQVTVSEPPAETVDLSERLAAISKRLSALQKLLIK